MKEFDKILGKGEKMLWEGSPSFWPFVVGRSFVLFVFGIFWMAFMSVFIFSLGPLVVVLPHFWVGIFFLFGFPVYNILVFKHTHYAVTDKRVLIQQGLIGRDFDIIDFDQITNAQVNVGVFDKILGKGDTGSVLISTAGSFVGTRNGVRARPYRISNVEDPYNVFKLFKKVTYDVKTDIQYPNKLRPGDNPGYKTKYDPKK